MRQRRRDIPLAAGARPAGLRMPAKDVEIKGNFSINDYTVTYKVDGKVIAEKTPV